MLNRQQTLIQKLSNRQTTGWVWGSDWKLEKGYTPIGSGEESLSPAKTPKTNKNLIIIKKKKELTVICTWVGDPYPTPRSRCPPEHPLLCPQGGGVLHGDTSACWTPNPRLCLPASRPDGSAAGPRTPVTGRRPRGRRRAPWTTRPEHTRTRSAWLESCAEDPAGFTVATPAFEVKTCSAALHTFTQSLFDSLTSSVKFYLCPNMLSIFNSRWRFRHDSDVFLPNHQPRHPLLMLVFIPCLAKLADRNWFSKRLCETDMKWGYAKESTCSDRFQQVV